MAAQSACGAAPNDAVLGLGCCCLSRPASAGQLCTGFGPAKGSVVPRDADDASKNAYAATNIRVVGAAR